MIGKQKKYAFTFLVLVLVMAVAFISISAFVNNQTIKSFDDVPGKHLNFSFINARDSVHYLPPGTDTIAITSVSPDGDYLWDIAHDRYPNANTTKILISRNPAGRIEYYLLNDVSNISFNTTSLPLQIEKKYGYTFIIETDTRKMLVGNPFAHIISDSNSSEKLDLIVTDILSGNISGTKEFDEILSYTDDVSGYAEILVFKAENQSKFDQYYQRITINEDGTIQLEAVILHPTKDVEYDMIGLSEGANDGVSYTIVPLDNSAVKIYLEAENGGAFITERSKYNRIIKSYTNSLE
ncbi:hypothetical protein [Methanolapillus millepedarum]|uniref:Uncharacterized protein n=1 Tax=Methanolapillus millepedarum TaxID=3028296 RepID=A0AA96V4G7_9EURY|nr:hypothetical protein MsAc7_16100 [Methanosarcinaceae archaeon Ac7]